MNAPLDEITTFLGTIPAEEHEARRRLKTCRNAGTVKATRTECAQARALAWMVTETASEWIYAPADIESLEQVTAYLVTLLRAADQAEALS